MRAKVALGLVALVALALPGAAPGTGRQHGETGVPLIVAARPVADPSDKAGPGLVRVTFSPDDDGRNDRVVVRVRAPVGSLLELAVHRASVQIDRVRTVRRRTAAPVSLLVWDGRSDGGKLQPTGGYVIEVCNVSSGRCARRKIVVNLRVLSIYTPLVRAVSIGETVPVIVRSDRRGPFTIDVAPPVDTCGPGSGAVQVDGPGLVRFRVPRVAPGLVILRVRNGQFSSYYPIVVHGTAFPLGDPPAGSALVVYPYITWRAYNQADDDRDGEVDSWYSHPLHPVMPLRGPFGRYRSEMGVASREATACAGQAFSRWLRKHGFTAQHVTDIELGRMTSRTLRRYAMIVFPDHTEYYERGVYERLLAYRNGGGNLYFMAGNPFYGEVSVSRSAITRDSYRYRTARRSDFRLASVGFRSCCWPRGVSPHYHLAPGVTSRLPWLFRGTSLHDGDAFGLALREVDAVSPTLSPPGTITIAKAIVPRFSTTNEAAYGYIGTRPIPFEPGPIREREIDIAYAKTGSGAVFSWANNGFLETLNLKSIPPRERAALDRVAVNVWARFTGAAPER